MTDDDSGTTDDAPTYDHGRQDPLDEGVKLRAKVKRGSGTRDQDTLLIEGRGATADDAADEFEAALSRAEANDYADRLRALQGDDDE
jgi:hypothetical protein